MNMDLDKMKDEDLVVDVKYADKEDLLEQLKEAVSNQNLVLAEILMEEYKKLFGCDYTDVLGILEASVYMEKENLTKAWEATQNGLKYNPYNFELYFIQGKIKEIQQEFRAAYLCYLQSVFYAQEEEDLNFLREIIKEFIVTNNQCCRRILIIMSAGESIELFKKCVNSIQKFTNSLLCETVCILHEKQIKEKEYLEKQNNIRIIKVEKEDSYTGIRNRIIQEYKREDIFLLSTDYVLFPNTIHNLAMTLAEQKQAGIVSSSVYEDKISNIHVSNTEEKKICFNEAGGLLVRRECLLEKQFDEQLETEKYAIMDLSVRNLVCNYENLINTNSIVASVEKKQIQDARLKEDKEYLKQKWGFNIEYYNGARLDLIWRITEEKEKTIKVLEIGCGTGATLLKIKNIFPNAEVYGMELQDEVARLGNKLMPIICGNIEDKNLDFPEEYFDYILIGDVLEHLVQPEDVLIYLKKFLKKEGYLITSIPNIQHYSAFVPMLFGKFEYTDSGILDKTHLRFFTWDSIQNMFERINYKIVAFHRNVTTPWVDPEIEKIIDKICEIDSNIDKESFMTLQYCVKVQKLEV